MLGGILLGLVEALGTGYVGDLTNLCRWPGAGEGMGWMGERAPTAPTSRCSAATTRKCSPS